MIGDRGIAGIITGLAAAQVVTATGCELHRALEVVDEEYEKVLGSAATTKSIAELVLNSIAAIRGQAPPCANHKEVQHRDGKPPWCNACGWRRPVASLPAWQYGKGSQ